MEMNRRIASGRLSEILGNDTVKIDRFVRTLGIKRAAERQFDRYPVSAKKAITSLRRWCECRQCAPRMGATD